MSIDQRRARMIKSVLNALRCQCDRTLYERLALEVINATEIELQSLAALAL